MKFLKPKFWDKNRISFFSILLFPITLIVILLSKLSKIFVKKYNHSIPIICIGNIYLGGTGKTPLSIEILSILKTLNKNPAFIKKKYKFLEDETELQKKFGPVYSGEKRINAINNAIKNNIDFAVLDDGYQDFSFKKDLSIIFFNEKQWIGN
jgi:tetraacyldisaccharide 4'-kinase